LKWSIHEGVHHDESEEDEGVEEEQEQEEEREDGTQTLFIQGKREGEQGIIVNK